MSDINFKFSIVMAVYNCENYLNKSIGSVINQDLDFRQNVQLIIVDDRSDDKSLDACLSFQEKYPENITVLSQSHSGVAAARNNGLSHVQGEYVTFLDADDYLSENALSSVYDFFKEVSDDCDVVAIPMKHFERENNDDSLNFKFADDSVIDLVNNPNNPQMSVSSAFFKSEVLNDCFETDLICSEDILFLYKILLSKKTLGVLSTPTYYFRKRYDLSAISDNVEFKKEYYTDRMNKFHLKLIEYSKSKEKEVPKFIQYLIVHDLKRAVCQDGLFMCDGESERDGLYHLFKKIFSHIDDDVISSLELSDSMKFFMHGMQHEEIRTDYENFNPYLLSGDEIIDNLQTPEITFSKVYFKNNSLIIDAYYNDYLDCDSFTVEAVRKSENNKIERFTSEFTYSSSYMDVEQALHENLKYFRLEIPVEDDTSKIQFKVLYHINGDKRNYMDHNTIVFNPSINLKTDRDTFNFGLFEFKFTDNEFNISKLYDFTFAVVMAIYNTENYLHQSIDSVINQSLDFKDNVQLILVNDGSEDSSQDILEEYQNKYPENITIINQENQGQAVARNNGFEKVKSKYVNFLDSDDYLSFNALEDALEFFDNHYDETDVVSVPITFFEKSEGPHMLNNKYETSRVIDLTNDPNNPQLHSNSAFFKSDVFRKYKFATNVVSSEDVIVINKILLEKKTLGVLNTTEYFYRKRYDESSTLDKVSSQKEFFIDKLRDYYLHLFNYAKLKEGTVPEFLKYTLAYDLQWVLKEDLDILNKQEQKEFWHYLNETLKYIDEEMILNNQFIRNEYTKKFFLAIKRKDLHTEIVERKQLVDTDDGVAEVEKKKVLLKSGDYVCGDLSIHRIWLDIVDMQDDFLNISGFLNSLFDIEHVSIQAAKCLNSIPSEKFTAKYVKYTKRQHMSFLSIPFQFKNTFDLKIPIGEDEKSKIRLLVNYHMDGDNTNFANDNIVTYYLPIQFSDHAKLSRSSNYKATKSHLLYFEYNTFYLMPSSTNAIKQYEKQNIKLLELESENYHGSELEMYKSVINLRKKSLSDFSKLKRFSHKKEIYLFQDRIDVADDNAYHLFRHACRVHDGVEKVFVLSRESNDWDKVSKIGKVVEYASDEHKLLFLHADKIITTHPYDTVINPFLSDDEDQRKLIAGLPHFKLYWLQHGVTKDNISDWMSKFDKNLSLIVTVSDEESKSFLDEGYGYDESIIQKLGFPRFDNLEKNDNRQILIIPTWRKNITENRFMFMNSEYFNNLNSFLHNPELLEMAKKGYKIVFRPHPELFKNIGETEETFVELFDLPDEIYMSRVESYQDLINNSSVLITDYSSVFFDFAYLKKPVIYYHPNDDYHYEGSYFNYQTMGFGDELSLEKELIEKIDYYISNNFEMEDEYKKRVDKFFTFTDQNNCKRVYDWILKN